VLVVDLAVCDFVLIITFCTSIRLSPSVYQYCPHPN